MRLPLLLSLVLAAMFPSALAAQVQLSRLEGRVVDAGGAAVGGATVTLSDGLGATVRRATTDASGAFAIADLPPGRYRLAVAGSAVASQTDTTTVTIADGLPVVVTLRVPPSFREALTVEAIRPAASIATRTSLGAESIARTPLRTGARRLQDVVATLPGWATEDNGLLHSRGVDDGFLYVVDGVPVYERLDQTSGLAPDPSTIDTLTVVTGYVPPEYGHKAGGVIDVRTRAAVGSWRGFAETGAGSESAADGGGSAGGAIGGGATLWLQASGQRSNRFLDPVHPDNFHNQGGSLATAGQLTAGGARDRLLVNWGGGGAHFDVPNTDEQEASGQAARQRVTQGAATVSWQRGWSGSTVSQVAGYARRARVQLDPSEFDTPLSAEADRRLTRVGGLAAVTHQAGRHVIKAGGELQTLRLAERFGFAVTDEEEAEEAGLSEAAIAFDVDSPFRFEGRARPSLFSAYVQDTWQATPALTLAAGLRFDRTTLLLSRQQWSPRLGAALAASPRTTLRASLSRFYQPPQPEYLLLASSPEARALSPFLPDQDDDGDDGGEDGPGSGGAEVEPERQWAVEAGVEHRFGRGLRLDMAYWQREVDEYADPNVFFGTTIVFPNAVASGRANGFDARLEVAPGGPWSGYASLGIAKVTQTGPITGGLFLEDDVADIGPGVEFTPDHDQRVAAAGGLVWTGRRGVSLSGIVRYESGTPMELDDDEEADELAERPGADRVDFDRGRVKPRTLVSVVGTLPVWQTARAQVSLRASVLNLFGARYAYNFGNPFSGTHFGAPRTASVAVRVETR